MLVKVQIPAVVTSPQIISAEKGGLKTKRNENNKKWCSRVKLKNLLQKKKISWI